VVALTLLLTKQIKDMAVKKNQQRPMRNRFLMAGGEVHEPKSKHGIVESKGSSKSSYEKLMGIIKKK